MPDGRAHDGGADASAADLHLQILERYGPPSLLATEDHRVVHLSERAGRFLRIAGGEPSRDLLGLARPDIEAELRTALRQAARDRVDVRVEGVTCVTDQGLETIDIEVRPVLRPGEPPRGFFLVVFDDRRRDSPGPVQPRSAGEQPPVSEELRSAAEELQISAEELQTVSEDLTTVNEELEITLEELGLAHDDFQNLIASTDIGTIFLDRALRLKLATPRARDVFRLRSLDAGRPLSEITTPFLPGDLGADARRVLDTLQTIEREVQAADDRWYLARTVPYRTTDERIEGVVMTFQDVTSRRRAESLVRDSEERLRLLEQEVSDRITAEQRANDLVRKLVATQEDERARVARELHNRVGQQLTALRLSLERLEERCRPDPGAFDELAHALEIAREVDTDLDFLAWQLRPAALDDLGLVVTLARYLAAWSEHHSIPAEFRSAGLEGTRLPAEIETTFYRVAQEALQNIAKHAHANRVDVILELRDAAVILVVEDSGVGFDPSDPEVARRGLGLTGMRERATLVGGTLDVESVPGQGTTVFVRQPLDARRPDHA